MCRSSTRALATVSCVWANRIIRKCVKPTEKRATKLGSGGRSCSSNLGRDAALRRPDAAARRPYHSLRAEQFVYEGLGIVNLSKRLDNCGGINRDGARLHVGVGAIGHE